MIMNFTSFRYSNILILCVAYTIIVNNQCEAVNIQKLQGLVKKLGKLIDNLQLEPKKVKKAEQAEQAEKAEKADADAAAKDETTVGATELPVAKTTTVAVKDPNKKYCDACTPGVCTEKEITYYGNLRKKSPFPKFYKACDQRMTISVFQKSSTESLNSACVYNMTLLSLNNDQLLACAKTIHTTEKAAKVAKYWTSGRYIKSCNNYVWCPEQEVFGSDVKWRKGYPKDKAGDCVALQLGGTDPDAIGLFNMKCSEQMNFFGISADIYSE